MWNIDVTNNFGEGLGFDEEDANGYDLRLINVFAAGNEDEGIKISEEDDGDVIASLSALTTGLNNGSKEGIEIEEEDDGDVRVTVSGSVMNGGDDEELKAEEAGSGTGTLKLRGSVIDALDLDNVDLI